MTNCYEISRVCRKVDNLLISLHRSIKTLEKSLHANELKVLKALICFGKNNLVEL